MIVTDADLRSMSILNILLSSNKFSRERNMNLLIIFISRVLNNRQKRTIHPLITYVCLCAWRLMNEIGHITRQRCRKNNMSLRRELKALLHQVNVKKKIIQVYETLAKWISHINVRHFLSMIDCFCIWPFGCVNIIEPTLVGSFLFFS